MEVVNRPRSKTFYTKTSLWYEEERIATFIDWPVTFISYRELAREGFFYLRTKDHCACVFCRGIIGTWEQGDTPRREHMRHFPHCDFVKGKVTPNVSLKQGISTKIASEYYHTYLIFGDRDVISTERLESLQINARSHLGRCTGVLKSSNLRLSMKRLLCPYCVPDRKEYLTAEVRLNSFTNWPEKVKQTPKDLADAGFYYCGLSDHVCCFHCGNGLRNFELEDDPWEAHARWFPHCLFVLLQKGIEFVDKVRREKPPYYPETTLGATYKAQELSDDRMEMLMELEIMEHVLEMGFARHVLEVALRKKVKETGKPFYYVDDILMAMAEETFNANNNNIMYTPAASQSSLPPLPSISRASPPLRSSTPTSQMATATTPQSVEVEEEEQGEVIAPISTPANAEVETGTLDSEDVLPEEPQQTENMQQTLALELEQIKENRVCKVCMDKEMDVVFLPCTHMVTCSSCAVALAVCPICRRDIQYAFKPIIS